MAYSSWLGHAMMIVWAKIRIAEGMACLMEVERVVVAVDVVVVKSKRNVYRILSIKKALELEPELKLC